MSQVETLPQSLVDTKTIVLKPRLDQGDLQMIGEKIKPKLFSKFILRPKPEDIRFLGAETYFEPYLIIGGKYSLDYCKKHIFKVDVSEQTTKVFVAGQEFRTEQSNQKKTNKTIKMIGEEHAHHERQSYFILDRMKREIQPERLPISPFDVPKKNFGQDSRFKTICISDETQIEFLRTKIAQRPADLAAIIREVFEITERIIAYYPMYQLTFENAKNQEDAIVTVSGITGEIIMNGTKRLAGRTIVNFPKTEDTYHVPLAIHRVAKTQPILNSEHTAKTDKTKIYAERKEDRKTVTRGAEENMTQESPSKISSGVFSIAEDTIAMSGNVSIPSGAILKKNLLVKGKLRIGDNCKIRGEIKAQKDVIVGSGTTIDGDLISGGNITLGLHSLVNGSLRAAGYVKINERAGIEIETRLSSMKETDSEIQLEVVEVKELHQE